MLFSKALVQLKYVQAIQHDLNGISTPKKRLKVQFLNQTYVVHLTALWQAFLERLLTEGMETLLASDANPQLLPLLTHSCERTLSRFNTPNRKNIDQLFLDGLGLSNVTTCWSSPKLSIDVASSTLAKLLEARHSIAHTASTSTALSYENNFETMEVIFLMAELLEQRVLSSLKPSQ
jgi:hypothetical protein